MNSQSQRFTGGQIATMVVAVCVAVVALPVGALAATGNLVNITDPVTASHKARVDSNGRLYVSDGGGTLTVDGAVRPSAPSSPWRLSSNQGVGQLLSLVGPTTSAINLTSMSLSLTGAGAATVTIEGVNLPSTATNCDPTGQSKVIVWQLWRLSDPFSVSFPTPLQWKPPSGSKACLLMESTLTSGTPDNVAINASGFLGG